METFDLENVRDDKRAQIESWWAHCTESNLDEYDYAFFLDASTTREELAAFLSPFDCADELVKLVMQTQSGAGTKDPADESTLVAALQDHVAEMAQNALVVGEDELAGLARSVSEFRLVDEIERPPNEYWLGADIEQAVSDAVRKELRSLDDAAARNFSRIVKEWMPNLSMATYVVQPLLSLDLDLRAFHRLFSLGAESKVTSDVAFVARLTNA